MRLLNFIQKNKEIITDIIIFIAIYIFLLFFFKPSLIFSNTITSGGDTASHYYPAFYLKNYLLPNWKIVGWSPGWYGGIPMFQFYFPLTFLFMVFLSFIIPLQIAFKLVTILGTFLLPLAAFLAMRIMKFKYPIPILAAVFTLPFLFNQGNSMWGGNIPSTLAGEFSESFSIAVMILFLASVYVGIEKKKFIVRNSVMFAVITFSHIVVTLVTGLTLAFFLLKKNRFFSNLKYLFIVLALGTALIAFWFFPLVAKLNYTTPFTLTWYYSDARKEIFPDILIPFYIFSVFGLYRAVKEKDGRIIFLMFPAIMGIILYFFAPYIGVIEIRFIPFLQLFPLFIAAYGLVQFLWRLRSFHSLPIFHLLLIIVLIATLFWVYKNVTYIGYWIEWNYSGFEAKTLWPAYIAVNNFLKGDQNDPRVVYEHSDLHDAGGTPRIFESLPLFSGRSTLEGLYLQSIETTPFVFYIQSEISEQQSCPFPQWKCTTFNATKAAKHLEMFNVKHVIARSDMVKSELNSNTLYELVANFEPFEVYELKTNEDRYVVVPAYEPVLFETNQWKQVSYYQWFSNENLLDIPLVFTKNAEADSEEFQLIKTDWRVDNMPRVPIDKDDCEIQERVENEEIIFRTNCIGKPHIIRISYFPNWQVEGADRIYLVSPSFMLLFPKQENVRVFYGEIWSDYIGKFLTVVGILAIVYLVFAKKFSLTYKKSS